MRQEIRATVTITYDADAELGQGGLREAVLDDLARLLDADSESPVEAQAITINHIAEEAEIYGNAAPCAS